MHSIEHKMHHFLPNIFFFLLVTRAFSAWCCLQHEREALLKFKADVNDSSNRLVSWRGNECCKWAGVRCNNKTGHVIMLDLRNSYYEWNNHSLSGEINPSLQNITELEYLDISYNNFSGNNFPRFISSYRNLNYLNLSTTGLSGIIPHHFGNLSKLEYLDLSYMPNIYISNVWFLSHLTSLIYLDMFQVNLEDSREWVQVLNTLPLLQSLYLGSNNLTTISSSITVVNFSSLGILSIQENEFNSRIPNWIGDLTKLTMLELLFCSFVGRVPNQLGNLTKLNKLYLLDYLEGPMPPLLNLNNLTELDITYVDLKEDISRVVSKLANDTLEKIELFWLYGTSLTGNLNGWISKMSNLKVLTLSYNNLNGTIPNAIGNLTSLECLFLDKNYFSGMIYEAHLANLSNLKELNLDSNYITVIVDTNWIPQFQLYFLYVSGCKLGPHFPSWLQNQSLITNIDMSNTEISDIVPNWFWNLPSLTSIDLSNNNMSGRLPLNLEHLTNLNALLLGNNRFEGEIPSLPYVVEYIDMSNNLFSGHLPTYIEAPKLSILVLSNISSMVQ
ncbi:hypothetical protein LUZ63_016545 [Rhynchospora breviuscula]|uniref:Leucine-rich repeat-containing N-terminal plant-type domain-containing protein n=1 Tax=Rhynchospora breviuscula TaxID=2022672 RepID=A0A9Q0C0F6_9POAL|nr:hypothetical protein LUZ63_016545 [Rhynchospora breviuscula]